MNCPQSSRIVLVSRLKLVLWHPGCTDGVPEEDCPEDVNLLQQSGLATTASPTRGCGRAPFNDVRGRVTSVTAPAFGTDTPATVTSSYALNGDPGVVRVYR